MSAEEARKNAICNFTMKVCSKERYIEIKRQILADKSDFEPYVAFRRIARGKNKGITPSNIHKFLSDNLIEITLKKCHALVSHYDADKDGLLSYKEFLEIVLPKEHPDLRAFVTQRECFDITDDEYLSYETEISLALLMEKEISIFTECYDEKVELDKLALSAHKIIEIIDLDDEGNLNFKNLRNFFHDSGLLPYDAEIISLLRRVDRDDDGVILNREFDAFLNLFFDPETQTEMDNVKRNQAVKQEDLKRSSPGRKIVRNKISMLSSDKKILIKGRPYSKKTSPFEEGIKNSNMPDDSRDASTVAAFPKKRGSRKRLERNSSGKKRQRESPGRFTKTSVSHYEEKNSGKKVSRIESKLEKPEDIPKYQKRQGYGESQGKYKYSKPPQKLSTKKLREHNVRKSYQDRKARRKRSGARNDLENIPSSPERRVGSKPKLDALESPKTPKSNQRSSSKLKRYQRKGSRDIGKRNSIDKMRRKSNSRQDASSLSYQRSRDRLKFGNKGPSPARVLRSSVTNSRGRVEITTEIRDSGFKKMPSTGIQNPYSPTGSVKSKRSRSASSSSRDKKVRRRKRKRSRSISRSPPRSRSRSRSSSRGSSSRRRRRESPLKYKRTSLQRNSASKHSPVGRYKKSKNSPLKKKSSVKRSPSQDKYSSYSHSSGRKGGRIVVTRSPPNRSHQQIPIKTSSQITHHHHPASPSKIVIERTSVTPSPVVVKETIISHSPKILSPNPEIAKHKNIRVKVRKFIHRENPSQSPTKIRGSSKIEYKNSPVNNAAPIRIRGSRKNLERASPKRIGRPDLERVSPKRIGRTNLERASAKRIGRPNLERVERVSPKRAARNSRKSLQRQSYSDPNSETFFNALALIVNQEKSLEKARRDLVSREDFFIKEIFNMIDKKGRGWFTIEDFRQFLTVIGVRDLDTRALIDLYSSFDSNQNCLLNFHELVNMVCPQSPSHAQFIDREIDQSARYDEVGEETLDSLADMFGRLFTLRRSIFDAKKMIRQEGVDLHSVFDELDRRSQGFITKEDIEAFLKSYSREFGGKMEELEVLANRMDIDKDSRINFKDFYMFFTL